MEKTLLDDALALAAQGFLVFPVRPDSRAPYIKGWHEKATSDPATIKEWWRRFNRAAIGTTPGPGVIVLDADAKGPRHAHDGLGALADLEAKHGAIPATVSSTTGGGGRHRWLRLPDGETHGNSTGALPLGLDVRGHRTGFVIAPPSPHPSGAPYRWDAGCDPWLCDIAPVPGWLLELIRADKAPLAQKAHQREAPRAVRPPGGAPAPREDRRARKYAAKVLGDEYDRVANTPKGGRNAALNLAALKLGHYVAGGDVDEAEAVAALEQAAEVCGLIADEGLAAVNATIASGLTAGKRDPKTAPRSERTAGRERRAAPPTDDPEAPPSSAGPAEEPQDDTAGGQEKPGEAAPEQAEPDESRQGPPDPAAVPSGDTLAEATRAVVRIAATDRDGALAIMRDRFVPLAAVAPEVDEAPHTKAVAKALGVTIRAVRTEIFRARRAQERQESHREGYTDLVWGWASGPGSGLYRVAFDDEGEPDYKRVCHQVPRLVAQTIDVTNQADPEYLITITWQSPSGRRSEQVTVPQETLADARKLTALARRSLLVTPSNAKPLAEYFTEVLATGKVPEGHQIRRLGWVREGGALRFVLPGVKDDRISLLADGGMAQRAAAIRGGGGTLADWANGLMPYLDPKLPEYSPAVAFCIAAAVCSPLLELASPPVAPFIVELAHQASSTGKTTVAGVAESVWARPGADGLRVTGTTAFAAGRFLGFVYNIPLVLDDAEKRVRPQAGSLDDGRRLLVHTIASGRSDQLGARDGNLRADATWRLVVIVTSNLGLARIGDPDDVRARVVQWRTFPLPKNRQDVAEAIEEHCAKHYGRLGPATVAHFADKPGVFDEEYQAAVRWCRSNLDPRTGWQQRLCRHIGAVVAAARVLDQVPGLPREFAEAVHKATCDAAKSLSSTWAVAESLSPGERLLQAIQSAIASRPDRWQTKDDKTNTRDRVPAAGFAGRILNEGKYENEPCWVFVMGDFAKALADEHHIVLDDALNELAQMTPPRLRQEDGTRLRTKVRVFGATVSGYKVWMANGDDAVGEQGELIHLRGEDEGAA